MVKLREPLIKKAKKALFVYDNIKIEKANFVGTFNEYGEPVEKTIKTDPKEFLVAQGAKNRVGTPSSNDIITPHEIIINGKTRYWFDYIDKETQARQKQENEMFKDIIPKKDELPVINQ